MAARLAARQMSDDHKMRLRESFEAHSAAVRAADLDGHMEHDRESHELFIAGSGNARIRDELVRVRSQLTLYSRNMSTRPGALDQPVIDAHEAILLAIEAGTGRDAETAARSHVRGILAFNRQSGSWLDGIAEGRGA
jgi:DNA-binding GntR family transcriptional regulator